MVVVPPPIDITALTSIVLSGIVGIISATQNSKCETLKCCWGFCDCIRKPDFNTIDKNKKNNIL